MTPIHTRHESLRQLSEQGVAVWLDDLSRTRIESGNLTELIEDYAVVGVTTNPSIFEAAVSAGDAYDATIAESATAGLDADAAVRRLTTDDVRAAADLLAPVAERTGGLDGRVSIEVDPRLAHDTEGTVAQARELWDTVDRPNIYIKIPATRAGLPAITQTVAAGISVNVTLIFSVQRYREVLEAYREGLARRVTAGKSLDGISSVGSFFVSRVDGAIDARLTEIGTAEATALKGRSAIANSRLAYQAYEEFVASDAWQEVADAGGAAQRPLWASTSVKDPELPDTLYVTELVAPSVVNTMPEKTLMAVADHGQITGETVRGRYDDAAATLAAVAAVGVDLAAVDAELEDEGVRKFVDAWQDLLGSVASKLGNAR